ncbi:MAG: hypothetical protein HOV66_07090 [Streptomycetaceae bacterium]|nr:hypothetical protein [Streptomycetaceae bacterium]
MRGTRRTVTTDAPIELGEAQLTRPARFVTAPRQGGAPGRAAVAIFDTSVPVYMQTVRETSICPELIPAPDSLASQVSREGMKKDDD